MFALLCEPYVSPSNLNNFILSELSFLKLLVQEVERMQLIYYIKLHALKKLPDTSLSREH